MLALLKSPRDDRGSVRVFVNVSAGHIVEFGQSQASVCLWWNVNSSDNDRWFSINFSIMYWYGKLNVKNRGKLNSIVKMCSKIVETDLRTITKMYEHMVTEKGHLVLSDATDPLCNEFNCFCLAGDLG